jgi:hypothetical protein
MKLLIACPSYNRPYEIIKHAMSWLPKCDFDFKVFVEPKQYRYYKQSIGADNVVPTRNDCYKSGQLNHAAHYAKVHGYDLVFIVDDDMWFLRKGLKKKDCHLSINEMLPEIIDRFVQEPNLGIVSIGSFPTHNYATADKRFVSKNKDCYGGMICRTELLKFPEEVKHFDDVILGLISWQSGYYTYIYNGIYQCTADGYANLKGGFQSFDRGKLANDNFELLKKYYPNVTERTETKMPYVDVDVSWYRDNFVERKLN